MGAEGTLQISVATVAEDIIQQKLGRKVDEAAESRYEAAAWLRKLVGVVGAKNLPAEPSKEEFRVGLRTGIILCNVLNKVEPGSIPNVIPIPADFDGIPEGAALSTYQFFENVKNFLAALEKIGIPTFDALDLEKGGNLSRLVDSVLALKSYSEWKQKGGHGMWKYTARPSFSGRQIARKNSSNCYSRCSSSNSEVSIDGLSSDQAFSCDLLLELNEMGDSQSMHMLVRDLISDKKQEEIPIIVQNMLSKVAAGYEQRLAAEIEQMKTESVKIIDVPVAKETLSLPASSEETTAKTPTKHVNVSDTNGPLSQPSIEEIKVKTPTKHVTVSDTNESLSQPSTEEVKVKSPTKHMTVLDTHEPLAEPSTEEIRDKVEIKTEDNVDVKMVQEALCTRRHIDDEEVQEAAHCTRRHIDDDGVEEELRCKKKHTDDVDVQNQVLKQKMLVLKQHRDVEAMKLTLSTAKTDVQLLKTKYQEEVKNLGKHLFGLAHAASNYQKVLEENRKLYNQVQDLKGSIRVYCRVRPFLPTDPDRSTTVDHCDERSITIATPSKNGKDAKKSFTFNKVFGPSATQGEVFSDTQPLIRSVLDGYNVCIFAYGQTGAGKTYTMSGPDDLTEENMGVNYRALNDLFHISEQRKNVVAYEISVQMTEIYNEQCRDLLAADGANKRLEIRNSSQKGGTNTNANLVTVGSTSDVINLMDQGNKNRAVSATAMNGRSSRSHSCLTIHVQGRDLTSGSILHGCLHLVDLAGSERVDKSEVVGDRLKEAQHINKSLAALGDVISSLASKSAHVPYRNSKLTQLLQDSLGGQAKTLMFVHISPEHEDVGETISTLKFAERVSTVELGAAKANKDSGSSSEVKDLKEQVASLKAALARKESEYGGSLSNVSSPSHYSTRSDVGPAVFRNNSMSRRKSLDPQDMITSPPSPLIMRSSSSMRVSGSVSSFGDFVKNGDDFSSEVANTDDSDEHEATTSDCSDPDSIPQPTPRKTTTTTTTAHVPASKLKKPSPRQGKTPELRNIAPPARKVSSGSPSPLHKNGKQAAADTKRRVGRAR